VTPSNAPVLLFPTHYLGNFILGLPWICQVLREHPDALVVLDSRFAELAAMVLPEQVNLLLYRRDKLASSQPLRTRLGHYWQLLRVLRRYRRGTLMDLEGERFTGVLSWLSRCQRRIGPQGKRAQRFYTDVLDLDYRRHRFNAFGAIVADFNSAGIPDSQLAYTVPEAVSRSLATRLEPVAGRPLVAIHPGASVSYKLWPEEHFVALVHGLENAGWQVVWVGAGDMDQGIIKAVMTRLPESSALDLCNALSFSGLVALYQHCGCFVGSDSGPMHLAASTGLPVLALFGPSVEAIWAPMGDNSRVLRGAHACGQDCDAWHCEFGYHCLTSLLPERVLAAVTEHARVIPDNAGSTTESLRK
jgi:heptosyltransferase-3